MVESIPPTGSSVKPENPWIYFRLAEFYLNYAEIMYELGDEETAREYINKVRGRQSVQMPPVTATGLELRDKIRNERRVELAFEGHRFFDLLRNGKTIVRKGGYHLPSVDEEVDWDFYKCVLPIPEDQFIFSPEMEQNPGYPKN